MRLTADKAARIKACRGVYSLRDTARHFNVSPATVHAVWHNKRHTDVPEAPEPPNVKSTRISPDIIVEEGRTLLERGLSLQEAADEIGVGRTTLYTHLRQQAPMVMVFK